MHQPIFDLYFRMEIKIFEGKRDHDITTLLFILAFGAENKKLNNLNKKSKNKKYRKSVIGKGINFCSTDYNNKYSNIPDSTNAFTKTNYLQGNQSCERQKEQELISNFARNGNYDVHSYFSAKERRCIKQVSTPDACKRSSPSHLYHNIKKDPDSSHRVHSNLGSANHSFIKPSIQSTCCVDSKWNQLNKITQGGSRSGNHEMRNIPLRNGRPINGLTQDLGSSISSHDHRKAKDSIKNHKHSCDASIVQNNLRDMYLNESPDLIRERDLGKQAILNSKYTDNAVLKEYLQGGSHYQNSAIHEIEKNLTNYFNSNEYPYNEVKSFLENNSSIPRMNTRESNESLTNKKPGSMYSDKEASKELFIIKSAKERHMVGSERTKPKEYKLFQVEDKNNEDMYEQNENTANQSLDFIRKEIQAYLEREKNTSAAKVIQMISNVFESNLSLRDYEIRKLLIATETNYDKSSKECDSNISKGDNDSKRNKKIKVLKYSNIEYAKDDLMNKDKNLIKLNTNKIRKKSLTSAGFSIENKKNLNSEHEANNTNFKYSEVKQAKDDLDDIDISYNNDSPSIKNKRQGNPNEKQKEGESIVPPLALKNIGSGKITQNTNTGKLTRTTMNTTQIRDKMPLNNLKK